MSTLTLGGSTLANKTGSVVSINDGVILPAGSVIQINQTIDQSATTRTGDKSAYASTGVSCTLANNIQTNSKLFATFSAYTGEQAGGHWAISHVLTIYQNGTNVCSNQLSSLSDNNGLTNQGSATGSSNNQYWRGSHSASVLFTPTGTDTAKKTVELYWRCTASNSFTMHLNSAGHSDAAYDCGATILTLMEIAQ
tara:strand:- start:349 stop:933 length:585 start_codon:yes stop_codon:yes gene_type:complete